MDNKGHYDKQSPPKKSLIRTKKETKRLRTIVTLIVLVVFALAYYLIDSGSYVATVDRNRISKYEYQFYLSQQKSATEQNEGIYYKSNEEKEAFWLETADGQNPWQEAKSAALDASKDYMIQITKARKAGLSVDADIKSQVSASIESTKQSMGFTSDKQFADYIKIFFEITPDQLRKISENLMLIDKFQSFYLSEEYKPEPVTEDAVKAYYDEDPKLFDLVDIRYVYLSNTDEEGKVLSQEQQDLKQKKAEEALEKIKQGEDIDKVITDYTDEEKNTSTEDYPLGSGSISYIEGNELSEWTFSNNPGDSNIIETESGIYVVKIEERTDFGDAKVSIKSIIENQARVSFYNEALKEWNMDKKYNIIKNERVYDSFSYK